MKWGRFAAHVGVPTTGISVTLKQVGVVRNSLSTSHPDLYMLNLTAKEFSHSGGVFENVSLPLFKVGYKELALPYATLIEAPQPEDPAEVWTDWHYAKDFINAELFTPEEVEQIRSYFAGRDDVTLKAERYTDFPVANIISLGAVPVGGYTGLCEFDRVENFNCPVRFWGFYDLTGCRKVAEVKEVRCYPNGRVKFKGRHGFTLSSKDLDALGNALEEAVLTEEVQTVRLELPVPRELSTVSWSESEEDLPL